MSRRAFGGWGWELSDGEFGRALALLGLIGAEVAGESRPRRPASFPLTTARATTFLDRAMRKAQGTLTWDIAPYDGVGGLRRMLTHGRDRQGVPGLRGPEALALAAAWNRSDGPESQLEIRPSPGLDNAWLTGVLQGALRDVPPHFALPEPQGRMRWNWPLKVGFAVGQEWLRDHIYDGPSPLSQSVAPLTESEVGPSRCDVLLLAAGAARLHDLSAMALPEATLVLVFQGEAGEDPLRARGLAPRTNAAGVVVVEVDVWDIPEWLRTFLRELSHLESVPKALRRAGRTRAFIAAPRLLNAHPLGHAATAMKAQLDMTAALPMAEAIAVEALPEPTMAKLGIARNGGTVPLTAVRETFASAAMEFSSESGGASHVAAVTRAAAPAIELLEEGQAEERYIRADVGVRGPSGWKPVRRGFLAGARHRVAVSIGPPDSDLIVSTAGPIEGLEAAIGHRLTIVLSEPALLRKPLIDTVELPRFGATEERVFDLPVRRSTEAVEGRVAILHRGRILQTALLRGGVYGKAALEERESVAPADASPDDPGIEIVPEANLRPGFAGLDDRTRFHSAVILNHASDGTAGGTAIGRKTALRLNLDVVKAAVTALSTRLEAAERDLAFNRPLDSAKSLVHLRLLALEGRNLYMAVGRDIESTFGGRPERIQVVSANPNTMLPVELIYDLPSPGKKPKLCPNAEEALRTGRCDPKSFHAEDALGQLDVICPSGFWGISKIIERQATRKADKSGPGFVVRSMPTRRQKRLGPLMPVLFAASDHVNDVDPKELARVSKALEDLTDRKVTRVDTWLDWAGQVKTNEPPLLLLLSHTELNAPEGASLEIARKGGTEIQAVANITRNFVNLNDDRPGPVVMLLGCTTAVPLETFQTFTVQFADVGASLVIGTIAPVLGRHAGRTAEALIEALKGVQAQAGGRRGIPVGEAIRDVRRSLLARGILMSMSLAAYGDADWQLPVEA